MSAHSQTMKEQLCQLHFLAFLATWPEVPTCFPVRRRSFPLALDLNKFSVFDVKQSSP